jgi:exosortase A
MRAKSESIFESLMSSEFNRSSAEAALYECMPALGWGRVQYLLICALAAVVALFYDTAWSMVSIWLRSETFAHGFLIVPISLWLVWEKRSALRYTAPRPSYIPLVLMLFVGFGWLLATLVDVLVIQQLAFVGILVLTIWAIIGTPAARLLMFPLGFLFFAVPVGEALIHPLMNFTVDFTVGMLRLTGIPVYREGTFFSIPSGDWSVMEACSGLRYLIASVTLGVLYAYLTYRRLWRRVLFMLFAIAVPVVANGIRAYMIVMIAHMSGNKLAHGIDHFVYGWMFFGIVVTIMFIIGAFWRDAPQQAPIASRTSDQATCRSKPTGVALAAVLIAGLGPTLAAVLSYQPSVRPSLSLKAPAPFGEWQLREASSWDWRPHLVGPDAVQYSFYWSDKNGVIGLYLGSIGASGGVPSC